MEAATLPPTRVRDPEKTREAILQAAFHEMHRNGFRSAGLDTILANAGVTKGALYHHFGSKSGLGKAVLQEVICKRVLDRFLIPLGESSDPVTALIEITHQAAQALTLEELRCGCPLNNLAQEMSPVDEGFRQLMADVFADWRKGISDALSRGQEAGLVRKDLDPVPTAAFIVAAWEGAVGLGKASLDLGVVQACVQGIVTYFESLRP